MKSGYIMETQDNINCERFWQNSGHNDKFVYAKLNSDKGFLEIYTFVYRLYMCGKKANKFPH